MSIIRSKGRTYSRITISRIDELAALIHANVDASAERMKQADRELDDAQQSGDQERWDRAVAEYNRCFEEIGKYLRIEGDRKEAQRNA